MTYTYTPTGVCSRQMTVEIENGMIQHVDILGGCNGNLTGIASLLQGMRVEDAERLTVDDVLALWGGLQVGRTRRGCVELPLTVLKRALALLQ